MIFLINMITTINKDQGHYLLLREIRPGKASLPEPKELPGNGQ